MANGSQYTVVRDFADDGAGAPGRSEKKEMQACADVIACSGVRPSGLIHRFVVLCRAGSSSVP